MAKAPRQRPGKGQSLVIDIYDYVVIDLETTGFSPMKDDIIELGALRVRDGEVVEEFGSLIKVNRRISPIVSEKTGINNTMLIGSPYLPEILPQFLNFIGDDILLGHNVHFDVNFLYDKSEKHLRHPFSNNFIDYLKISKRAYSLPNYQLSTIARHLGISTAGAHRAVDDCHIVHGCYAQTPAI